MPIYEYKCEKCGEQFELRRSITGSDDDIECPRCGSKLLNKVYSCFGISSPGAGCSPGGIPSGGG